MRKRALLVLWLTWAAPALANDPPPRDRPGYANRLGRFGAGGVLAGLGLAATESDPDAARHVLASPGQVEFLLGLASFDGALRGTSALAAQVPGLDGRIGAALKHNAAMASALALTEAVRVDLGDLAWSDLARGDASKLSGASVSLAAPDPLRVGAMVASFAVAEPAWSLAKRGGRAFASAIARRVAMTAGLKLALAVAPVPGSRLAAAGVLALDFGLAALDLAGLLVTAHHVEALGGAVGREVLARERRSLAAARAEAALGRRDPIAFEDELAALARVQAAERDRAWLPVAAADHALVRELRAAGVARQALDALAAKALADHGEEGALPAFSLALQRFAADLPQAEAARRRHAERLAKELPAAAAARRAARDRDRAELTRLLERAPADWREPLAEALELASAANAVELDLAAALAGTPGRSCVATSPEPTRGFLRALETPAR